jgi:hypothetical protein
MKLKTLALLLLSMAGLTFKTIGADAVDAVLQAKVDAQVKQIQAWASDPVLVNAVKAQNASQPADFAAMTQEKWAALTVMDPFVRSFNKNGVGLFLKNKKTDLILRMFVSDANGIKVGFSSKTLSWSHKGDPKHEQPMTGKTWQGPLEQDKATGLQQVQVSVPVLDGDKPIGSLVVGLSVAKLKE